MSEDMWTGFVVGVAFMALTVILLGELGLLRVCS